MRFTAPVESRCAIPPWPVKRSRLYIVVSGRQVARSIAVVTFIPAPAHARMDI